MPSQLPVFREKLKNLRLRRGISQKELVDRVPDHYSSESAYRKVENGPSLPDREAIVAILTLGLKVVDVAAIDELLADVGYEGMTDEEVVRLGLNRVEHPVLPQPPKDPLPRPTEEPPLLESPLVRKLPLSAARWIAIVIVGASVVALAAGEYGFDWLVVTSSMLCAAYFAISVLLETAYLGRSEYFEKVSLLTFSFVLALLTALVAGDLWTTNRGHMVPTWIPVVGFVVVAILQLLVVCPLLPPRPIVLATYQTQSAQAAHFKNTIYEVFAGTAFWIVPLHCVAAQRAGSTYPSHHPFCPPASWLLVLLGLMLLLAVPMTMRLLDSLVSGPFHNRFLLLFYTRGAVYFSLPILSLLWYSSATS